MDEVIEEFRISTTTYKTEPEAYRAAEDRVDEYCERNQIPRTGVSWKMGPDPRSPDYVVTVYRQQG
jgi:hypothetical protein